MSLFNLQKAAVLLLLLALSGCWKMGGGGGGQHEEPKGEWDAMAWDKDNWQ
jgi:hypothetical protein